jgi:uncharacterized protein YhjY with autotransporter beta-barrel domain
VRTESNNDIRENTMSRCCKRVNKLPILNRLHHGVLGLFIFLFSVNAVASTTISPSNQRLDFGYIEVGSESEPMTVTLTNTNVSLDISRDSPIPFITTEFIKTGSAGTCPNSIAPGDSCTLQITYAPTTEGEHTADLILSGDDGNNRYTYTIRVSGTSIPRVSQLGFNSNGVDFGAVNMGTQSNEIPVTLTNTGNIGLSITDITTDSPFSQSHDCPAVLSVNSSCTLSVSVTPDALGQVTGNLTVTATGHQGSFSQSLSLAAIGQEYTPLTITPNSLNFPATNVGTLSDAQTLSITNQGNCVLQEMSVSITGDFHHTNNCSTSLAPDEVCQISVTAAPLTQGDLTGALVVSGNCGPNPISQSVALSVQASGVMNLVASDTELIFPNVPVNSSSDSQALTLTNQGEIALPINAVTTQGDFEHTNECGESIGAGESCPINVVFSPQAEGTATGSLVIETSSGTLSVTLSGTTSASNLLSTYAGGDPNVESTSDVISDACTSDRVSDRMQEDCDAVVSAAIQGDSNTASALRQITPESATKANFTARRGGERQVRNLGSRISALRAGVRGLSLQGLHWRIDDQSLPVALLMDAYEYGRQPGGGASGDNTLLTSKLGVFVTGAIGTGSKDETEQESGLDFDTYGLTIGADYRITQQFILGGALGYIDTQTELDNNTGKLDTKGYSLSLYGTYYHDQNYFFDFAATYGSNNFDQKRRIVYQLDGRADVNQDLLADYDGDLYSLFIGSGYDFYRGKWAFGPRLDLEYLRSNVDEFAEEASDPNEDGGGWATRISDTNQTWLTFNLGGKVSYTHSASWGVMIPYARLDWMHEFKDDAQTITAHFVDDPAGNAIEFSTDDPDRDYMRLSIGTSVQFENGIASFIDYNTLLANSEWRHHAISLGMRMAF